MTLPAAPQIRVSCSWPQCAKHNVEVTVPSGVILAEGVLLTGSMSCTTCGMPMNVLGAA